MRIHVFTYLFIYFKISFIYFSREGKGGRKRGREGTVDVREIHGWIASHTPPTEDLARIPGMCPGWESNQEPFGSQVRARYIY